MQQELTFCVPTHGAAPEKANEIATTDLALKALGVEPEIGAEVPLEFELRGKTYHYDMVLSGWWEASNDSVSVATVSEQFIKENPDVVQNTYAVDHVMSGVTFSDVVLKNKANVQPATSMAAPPRRSLAVSGAPVSRSTPVTYATRPSMLTAAPRRRNSSA